MKREGDLIYNTLLLLCNMSVNLPYNAITFVLVIPLVNIHREYSIFLFILCLSSLLLHTHITHISNLFCGIESHSILYRCSHEIVGSVVWILIWTYLVVNALRLEDLKPLKSLKKWFKFIKITNAIWEYIAIENNTQKNNCFYICIHQMRSVW